MRSAGVILACLVAACDPGGSYRVPGATLAANGRAYVVPTGSGTSVSVDASWFTSTLSIELSITNGGTTPLVVRPGDLHVADRVGALDPNGPAFACSGHERETTVSLAPGATCQIFASFQVHVDRDRLRTLHLVHRGVTRERATVPIVTTLVMD